MQHTAPSTTDRPSERGVDRPWGADDNPADAAADRALDALLATDVLYGPGFANHGPMAVEALEHMGRTAADIERFMADYTPRLTAKAATAEPMVDWEHELRAHTRRLAPEAAALAGHGLLRLAHAVRAVRRHDRPLRRADLTEAVAYWASGHGIAGRTPAGSATLEDALRRLPRLRPADTTGALTRTLKRAAEDTEVQEVLASIAPPVDHGAFTDALALASVDRYLANGDERSFVFLHGVTVPTMAAELLPFLDDDGRSTLAAALAGFVLYAVAGFDNEPDVAGAERAEAPNDLDPSTADDRTLAAEAAATLDDHTIKFTDSCLTLARRTGATAPRLAAAIRIAATRR
ncbi:MAG: hypothetical protein AAGD35_02110 [Actinomycetota bacterium]